MQFSSIVSLLSAAAVAVAQSTVVGFDSGIPSRVTVGVPVNLPYYSTGPVDIRLRRGPSNNLDQGTVLISGTSGGSYRWVPTGLADGDDYALQISQDDETNYFGPITVTGGSSSSSSSSSSSASRTNSASRVVGPSYTPAQTPVTPVYTPRANSTTPTSSNSAAPSGSSNPAPYPVPVPNRNSTTTSSSASQPSETAGSGAAATSAPPGGNGASQLGSSLALIVGIVAAFAYLN